jgi:serine/threonine protein kinase
MGNKAERTSFPGAAYQSRHQVEGTRSVEVGYQSMLATSLEETIEERYQIGQKIENRYEVRAIHKGSMGVVYGTYDHKEKLPRALKTLQKRFSENKQIRDLFIAEAFTWIKLDRHPFIIQAYLVEEYEGQKYVITEYIRGEEGMGSDLRSWLGHPKLTIQIAIEMALQIAQGMQHAQIKIPGIIHRDLKPANVLVDSLGRAKITDFGLVHAVSAEAGTPAYMSPEQWLGQKMDIRSDIYSYGCILYEMFTGHRIFNAKSIEEWKQAHLEYLLDAPQILKPELPVGLEELICGCMAKQANFRPQNWDEVVELCAHWFYNLTGQPPVLNFSSYKMDLNDQVNNCYSLLILGKNEETVDVCKRVLSIDPNNENTLVSLGNALDALERFDEALIAWSNMGVTLFKLKRYDESIMAINHALAVNPNYYIAWNNLGASFYMLKRYEEAIGAYSSALGINPNFAAAWHNKGLVFYDLKQYNDAIAHYDRAIKFNSNYSEALFNKGLALKNLKRFKEADAVYKRALAINPKIGSYEW